jgi:hypothetical protein
MVRVSKKLLLLLIVLIISQSTSCRERKSKKNRVRSKRPKKTTKAPKVEKKIPKEEDKPKETVKPEETIKPEETAKPEETKKPEETVNEEILETKSEASAEEQFSEESKWGKHIDSLMKSNFFLKSKGYYDSIHQCGLEYFEKSIEYLTVKSSEYYSVIRQNEAMRNGFLLLIYSFLLMKVFSVLCSCCRGRKGYQGDSSALIRKLQDENKALNVKLNNLSLKLNKSSSEIPDIDKIRESLLNEMKQFQKSSSEKNRSKDDEEIFTFFHDSLRDLWSEIKSIKSRLRETDVSQLSLNFDPKLFKVDQSKKVLSQTPKNKNKKPEEAIIPNMSSPVLSNPLGNIKETPEDPVTTDIPSTPAKPPKKMPIIKPKLPKKKITRGIPKRVIPKPMKAPILESNKEGTPKKPEEPPVKEKSPLPKVESPKKTEIVKEEIKAGGEVDPRIMETPKEEKKEPVPVETNPPKVEEPKKVEKVETPVAISKPQKPMIKGPRIPTRKIPSRMPMNRRVPRKPIKVLKKPTAPKQPSPSQGNMGV